MPANYAWFVLSGGPGNSSPRNSLGGQASRDHGSLLFSQSATPTAPDTIPGLTVIGGHGIPLGVGTITLNYGAGTLTWTDSTAASYVEVLGSDGYYKFANASFVLVFHIITSQLPSGTNAVTYNISKNKQNLFDNLLFSERSSNHTNYRCIYLYNGFPFDLVEATVSFSASPSYGVLSIGTEYMGGLTGTVSQLYAENVALSYRGAFMLSGHSPVTIAEVVEYSHRDGTFLLPMYPSTAAQQSSDGISEQLPSTIVDEYDSTGVLSNISWKTSLGFPTIPQGKYVSLWVKRYVAAGTTGSSLIEDGFTLQIAYRRA